eukprot:COSAG05_NODE_883_length_6777_cov_36.660081_3_plen_69_part_00
MHDWYLLTILTCAYVVLYVRKHYKHQADAECGGVVWTQVDELVQLAREELAQGKCVVIGLQVRPPPTL